MFLAILIISCLRLTVDVESRDSGAYLTEHQVKHQIEHQVEHQVEHKVDFEEGKCLLVVSEDEILKMPIAFKNTTASHQSIIYPDNYGILKVNIGDMFSLACPGSKFDRSDLVDMKEVKVSCVENNLLQFNEINYEYKTFRCSEIPKSELIVTDKKCQQDQYTVVSVGFRISESFLVMYNVCFDTKTKHSLYSWHRVRTPYYNIIQLSKKRPGFKKPIELYGVDFSMDKAYKKDNQEHSVEYILKSKSQAADYIQNDGRHFLARGHYTTMTDFYYIYQQYSTFNYANTTPQWQCFNNREWSKVEDAIRSQMAGKSETRHLIVTGSFRWCTLPDKDNVLQRIFLVPPSSVPVPLFVWKLLYDMDTKTGTVYVGLNNPYVDVNDDDVKLQCPNTCVGQYSVGTKLRQNEKNVGLIHCCTMESFFSEQVYGELDPIVFSDEQ